MFCAPATGKVCLRTGLIAGTAFALDCAGQADVCAWLERVSVFQEVVTGASEVVTKCMEVVTKSMEVVTEMVEVVTMISANHRNQRVRHHFLAAFEKTASANSM